MAQADDLTVVIKADARPINRTLRRIQFDLWVMRWGWQVLAVAGLVTFALGIMLGIVVS